MNLWLNSSITLSGAGTGNGCGSAPQQAQHSFVLPAGGAIDKRGVAKSPRRHFVNSRFRISVFVDAPEVRTAYTIKTTFAPLNRCQLRLFGADTDARWQRFLEEELRLALANDSCNEGDLVVILSLPNSPVPTAIHMATQSSDVTFRVSMNTTVAPAESFGVEYWGV